MPSQVTAAASLSLTGPMALQGNQAARGLECWASADGIDLLIVDDEGSPATALTAYRAWMDDGVDVLLGPYGSGLVRRVRPVVSGRQQLLWNHGGSADDLARPGVVPVPAPASTYFRGAVELARARKVERLVLLSGTGPFAASVASGAQQRAIELGLTVEDMPVSDWAGPRSWADTAVLVVGTFADDVAVVEQIRAGSNPVLLGCVAAGLAEFGQRLGTAAEGVVGPVQWLARDTATEVGPTGSDFARLYRSQHGEPPGYVAAQAVAAGYLAAHSLRHGLGHRQIQRWRTTTLLGDFRLDESWRQVGHGPTTVEWRNGHQEPVAGQT